MKATQRLHDLGQSIWLDDISRKLLDSGTLERYIRELNVTGLTSNPSIFAKSIKDSADYDESIAELVEAGKSGEDLFFELAIDDLRRAADMFLPIHDQTNGQDGWVSLEVSPLLAHDTDATLEAAKRLHAQADRRNLFIKIPGTPEGLPAIEESIFAGVPINVTLLFSREQYLAAAGAYMRGVERRITAGLSPDVRSVASVFISRWDVSVTSKVPEALHNQLGIAIAKRTYKAYHGLSDSSRATHLIKSGGHPQRLLWGSTGSKDPKASDILYVTSLAAPKTINTMPEGTLKAFADHGERGALVPLECTDCEEVLGSFAQAGIDIEALAEQLQDEGTKSFVKSWNELLQSIQIKSATLKGVS